MMTHNLNLNLSKFGLISLKTFKWNSYLLEKQNNTILCKSVSDRNTCFESKITVFN